MINDKDALSVKYEQNQNIFIQKEIKELLTKGTLDQLKDCLDFAPEGVIELLKRLQLK